MRARFCLLLCWIVICGGSAYAGGATLPSEYGKIYELRNKSVTVKIAPQVGRVVYFGFNGGKNMLWLNDTNSLRKALSSGASWPNWGGDKVWPAQQASWRYIYGDGDWPPQSELDGKPFRVVRAKGRLFSMESQVDSKLHVVLTRTFILDKESATLRIENTLMQMEPTPWPVQIWSVTQSQPPNYTLLDISSRAPDRKSRPFKNLWDSPLSGANASVTNSALRLSLSPELDTAKAGTIGDWCAAVYGDTIFVQKLKAPIDGCYPDGANIEVFSSKGYTELELLSPSVHLPKRDYSKSTTIWKLLRTSPETTPAENIKAIRASLKNLR
jgi:hypothetical protein